MTLPVTSQATLTINKVWPYFLQLLPLPLQKHGFCKRPAQAVSLESREELGLPPISPTVFELKLSAADLLFRITCRCAVPFKCWSAK